MASFLVPIAPGKLLFGETTSSLRPLDSAIAAASRSSASENRCHLAVVFDRLLRVTRDLGDSLPQLGILGCDFCGAFFADHDGLGFRRWLFPLPSTFATAAGSEPLHAQLVWPVLDPPWPPCRPLLRLALLAPVCRSSGNGFKWTAIRGTFAAVRVCAFAQSCDSPQSPRTVLGKVAPMQVGDRTNATRLPPANST